MKEALGIIAVAISIIGILPYLLDSIRGKIKPHFVSWLIWSIITLIAFFGQMEKGAGSGAWVTGAMGVTNIIIAAFAFKNGTRNVTGMDKKLFFGTLLAIAFWVLIKEPLLSILVVIAIDASAVYFTVKKAFSHPKSENAILFYSNLAKTIIAIIALQQYNIVTVIYPVYQLVSNSALVLSTQPLWIKRLRRS